jgi:hypothetical protein
MAARRLDITLHLDRSQQAAMEAAARADSKKTAQQLISDTDAAEKAKVELIRRANAQKVAESAKATKTETELAKEAAAAREKSEKDLQAEISKAKKQAAADFTRIIKESEAEAKRIDRERLLSEQKLARETLQAHQAKTRAAQQFLSQEDKAQQKLTSSQFGTIKSIAQMAAGFAGLSSAGAIIGGISRELDRAAAYAQKTAEEILRIRGGVRELAALRGELGQTGPTTGNLAAMSAQTLQTPEEAMQTQQTFLGVAELAVGKSIDKNTRDQLAISAGKFQSLEGGDPSAHGTLMGQVALQSKGKLTQKEAEARAYRIHNILQPGAFKNDSQGLEQVSQLNGYVMSGVLSDVQAAGLSSAFSLDNPGSAATSVQSLVQATIPAQFKARGMKLDPEMDTEKTFEYLKKLGVKDETDPIKVANRIAKDVKEQAAKDPNFSIEAYLPQHGYGNIQQVAALRNYTSFKNQGILDPIEDAMSQPLNYGPNGRGVITELHEQRTASDPYYQGRKVQGAAKLAALKKGKEDEPYELARQAAFAKGLEHGDFTGEYSDFKRVGGLSQIAGDVYGSLAGTGTVGGLDSATSFSLREQAKKMGLAVDNPSSSFDVESDKKIARQIDAAGGDVTGNVTMQSLEKGAKRFEEIMTKVADKIKDRVPANVQARPNQPALRP